MATRKKTKTKSIRSKKSDGRKSRSKQLAQKRRTPKKLAERKAAPKKATAQTKTLARTTGGKTKSEINKKNPNATQKLGASASRRKSSGLQSGDLEGLSKVESVDSESVDELMEEGSAFEAGIVSGVENSRERDRSEVRTREVPE